MFLKFPSYMVTDSSALVMAVYIHLFISFLSITHFILSSSNTATFFHDVPCAAWQVMA